MPGLVIMKDVAIAKAEFDPNEKAVTKIQDFQVRQYSCTMYIHNIHVQFTCSASIISYYSSLSLFILYPSMILCYHVIVVFLRYCNMLSVLLVLISWLCTQCLLTNLQILVLRLVVIHYTKVRMFNMIL